MTTDRNPANQMIERVERRGGPPTQASAHLSGLVQQLGRLVADHVALARVELSTEAAKIGTRAATLLVLGSFLLAGYFLMIAGIAIGLSAWLRPTVSLLIVGGLNLIAGACGVWIASARWRRADGARS
jgi:putative superfamily III holin-X